MNILQRLSLATGIERDRFTVGGAHCDVCLYSIAPDTDKLKPFVSSCKTVNGYFNMELYDELIMSDLTGVLKKIDNSVSPDTTEEKLFLEKRFAFIYSSRISSKIYIPENRKERSALLRLLYDPLLTVDKLGFIDAENCSLAVALAALSLFY